jgi:acyl-CoA synthetase (AMP-forming)/AMP-acid ligase II
MSRENIATFDLVTKVWTGPMGKYPYPLTTYTGDLLLKAFDANPEKVVQINLDEGTEWIARDLKLAAIRVAQNLLKVGMKPEDVIGFNVANSQNVIALVLGSVLIGAAINPLHVSFTKDSIKQMFAK